MPARGSVLASQLLLPPLVPVQFPCWLPMNLRTLCFTIYFLKKEGVGFSSSLTFSYAKVGDPTVPPKLYTVANGNSPKESQAAVTFFSTMEKKNC